MSTVTFSAMGSPLVERNGILREIGGTPDEILTQHFELRALLPEWTTLDRYLERNRGDLDSTDKITLSSSILALVAELHRHGISHRDLGHRCLWVGGAAKVALSGLMSCQLPGEESVGDWLPVLRSYSTSIAAAGTASGAAKSMDVYCVARIVAEILSDDPATSDIPALPPALAGLTEWTTRALSTTSPDNFANAVDLAAAFGEAADALSSKTVDQSILDRFQTTDVPYVKWSQSKLLSSTSRCTIYTTTHEGASFVVKVWNGVLRGISTATDLALVRLVEGASRLQQTPVDGLPAVAEVALSPVGPYLVYRMATGEPLLPPPVADIRSALRLCVRFISTVSALHDLGYTHGDIAPKNVLYDKATEAVCLLDPFDFSLVGDGSLRTPDYCPANYEVLNEAQIDRFATLKICAQILSAFEFKGVSPAALIATELERPAIETFDVALSEMRQSIAALDKPESRQFIICTPHAREAFFRSDDGKYFLLRRTSGKGRVEYTLTGLDAELTLVERDGALNDWKFSLTNFNALSYASRNGIAVDLSITVLRANDQGFAELYEHLKTLYDEIPGSAVSSEEASVRPSIDVRTYWRRLMDLEADDQIELEITREVGTADLATLYEFRNRGRNFDFDSEDVVDVCVGPYNKRIGEVDLALTDPATTLAVNGATRRLAPGDLVVLSERRERSSIDRRAKAVRRILDGEAPISKLLDYFSPQSVEPSVDFGIVVPEEELAAYGLNEGQKDAFRSLLRVGPVGLLQGPPGTGKTRFIASFVHWLITKGGAHRILIASQSHEAVNNAIEALLSLFKKFGGRPNLLRIGSKGLTDKIRPYHTAELRERYRTRFENALKHRVTLLASARGIPRAFSTAIVDMDETLGVAARRVSQLRGVDVAHLGQNERERHATQLSRAEAAFKAAGAQVLGRSVDPENPLHELEQAYLTLLPTHPRASPSDLRLAVSILQLSREWLNSMASPQRNFEEFLAKTRTIVTATCVGVGQTRIRIDNTVFDWVIVDEAARCTPSELAVPIQLGRRVMLVGDHLQLMPMIRREHVEQLREEVIGGEIYDLLRSDFERAFTSEYGDRCGRKLTKQYRMHPAICRLVSECFYQPHEVTLTTAEDRVAPAIFDSPNLPKALSQPMCWIDTTDQPGWLERQPLESTSFYNDAEISAVIALLEIIAASAEIRNALVDEQDECQIGVISMYSEQKNRLELAFARHAWCVFRRNVTAVSDG